VAVPREKSKRRQGDTICINISKNEYVFQLMKTHEMLPEKKKKKNWCYRAQHNTFLIQILNVAYVTQNALKLQ
jgi:hypothetical protein